jgi:hypothetical protein
MRREESTEKLTQRLKDQISPQRHKEHQGCPPKEDDPQLSPFAQAITETGKTFASNLSVLCVFVVNSPSILTFAPLREFFCAGLRLYHALIFPY